MSALTRTPFMPPLNSLWMFTRDWPVPAGCVHRRNDTLQASFNVPMFGDWPPYRDRTGTGWYWTDERREEYEQWHAEEMAKANAVIPAGTVVSFNRYHASNSGDVEMTLQFYRSPDKRLTPKKRGGTGKGDMRFYLNIEQFNSLGEMEPFDDTP